MELELPNQEQPEPDVPLALEVFLDTQQCDSNRRIALIIIVMGRGITETVVKAAIELALTAEHPAMRASVWRDLDGRTEPVLIDPLLYVLKNEKNADVRAAAVGALGDFADASEVREALVIARYSDAQERVREAARYELLSPDEKWEELMLPAMSDSTPENDRVIALYRLFENAGALGQRLTETQSLELVMFAQSASEPKTRLTAWWALTNIGGPEVAPPMLEALMSDPNESVRESAATFLGGAFFGEPGVAEGLRYVSVHDPSLIVRGAAADELRSHER